MPRRRRAWRNVRPNRKPGIKQQRLVNADIKEAKTRQPVSHRWKYHPNAIEPQERKAPELIKYSQIPEKFNAPVSGRNRGRLVRVKLKVMPGKLGLGNKKLVEFSPSGKAVAEDLLIEYSITGTGKKSKARFHIQRTDSSATLSVAPDSKQQLIGLLKRINAGEATKEITIGAEVFPTK
ncbi:hypothetical protein KKG83_07590 [Candidatus Micrarchaeota archaeon]|nr:hypothetical protein [Candidatus Micrarchaeota archaeon]